jgi:hypothetical protein
VFTAFGLADIRTKKTVGEKVQQIFFALVGITIALLTSVYSCIGKQMSYGLTCGLLSFNSVLAPLGLVQTALSTTLACAPPSQNMTNMTMPAERDMGSVFMQALAESAPWAIPENMTMPGIATDTLKPEDISAHAATSGDSLAMAFNRSGIAALLENSRSVLELNGTLMPKASSYKGVLHHASDLIGPYRTPEAITQTIGTHGSAILGYLSAATTLQSTIKTCKYAPGGEPLMKRECFHSVLGAAGSIAGILGATMEIAGYWKPDAPVHCATAYSGLVSSLFSSATGTITLSQACFPDGPEALASNHQIGAISNQLAWSGMV